MRWAASISTATHLGDAVAETAESIHADLAGEPPDLLFVFPSVHHSDRFEQLPREVTARFPGAAVAGCSAGGVIGGGREIEGAPGLALIAATLPGVDVRCHALPPDPRDWRPLTSSDVTAELVIFSDPLSCNSQALIGWLDREHPECTKIGGLASGAIELGGHALFTREAVHRTGALVVALTGNIEVDTIVAQGCRPIGQPLFVTRAERNIILELDGRPALGVLEGVHAELSADDQKLLRTGLHLGLGMQPAREHYEQGDFLIRNLIGVDADSGAFAVDFAPLVGQVVQFHLRDAATSADDLSELLSRHQYAAPAGALLFSCLGRGKGLYGVADHDSQMFGDYLGAVPLGGFFGNGEIGPIHGQTFLHGYTSSFGLFRPKQR